MLPVIHNNLRVQYTVYTYAVKVISYIYEGEISQTQIFLTHGKTQQSTIKILLVEGWGWEGANV